MYDATAILPALALNDLPPAEKAAVSFLARYTDPTLGLYTRYIKLWFEWCGTQGVDPLAVERGHLELWVHEFAKTHKPSTVGSAFTPISGYYKYADYDGLIPRNPALYVRLPKIHYAKPKPIDRYELRKFLAAAKDYSPRHWCLTQMLCVMGLRISEACAITVEQALVVEQGMRVLHYIGKGSKPATSPIPYQSLGAFDAAIDGRTTGWLIARKDGGRLSRHGAAGLVETVNRHAGLDVRLGPHYLRKLGITQGREAGLSLDEVRIFARHESAETTLKHYDLTQTELGSHPGLAIAARLAV